MKAQYKWTIVDDLIIGIGTKGVLPDDVWDKFIADLRSKPVKKYLSLVVGSIEPTSVQRKKGVDAAKEKGIRVAVVTDERLVRGIVTAASWFGTDIQAFDWSHLRDAIDFLQVQTELKDYVERTCEDLRRSV